MGLKILHLSDLHISFKEDSNHEILRKNIIKYLEENSVKVDIVAFTGDIIDRNDVEAFSKAIDFFDNLLRVCGLSKDRLVVVPGNHDMERNSLVESVLNPERLESDEDAKECWKYIKIRMNSYAKFIDELGIADKESVQYGYGVKKVIVDGKTVCFNLLNSAWTNKGNSDYRNLFVGRWQLEENRKAVIEMEDKDIVITMMHHPLSWLTDKEAEMLKDYMCHEDKLCSHILLHGHIHDSKTLVETTPNGEIASLITGIGYPKAEEREAGQPKICSCKFSIYDIDIENGEVDNFCLTSTPQGNFVPNTTLYKGSEDGHYYISINPHKNEKKEEIECMELDPIPVINCWSGRTEELDLLSKENTNVITISGVGGQGKTALAAKFIRETPDDVKQFEKKLWVDCRELPNTMHSKLLDLLEKITGGVESSIAYKDEQLSDTIKRFFKHISEERILIVFDNVDAYVNIESEELVGELNDFVEIALTQQHNSLLILTCRVPIYDSRANFRAIKLDGLKEPEGIRFLQNRGVKIEGAEDEAACKQIIRITKGHPWWLGLIAGQMVSANVCPSEYLDENRDGILARDSQVEKFFGAIWEKLSNSTGKVAQNIVRYLAETTRPLTVENLSLLLGENFKNTNKAIKMLTNLNLLIVHAESKGQNRSFQVHPLVREFVHKNYDKTVQKPLVDKLVELIIGTKLYEIIFVNDPAIVEGARGQCNPRDIIDSIDTCLTSRNDTDALTILSSTYDFLVDGGYHAQFLALGERVLDSIDWKKEEMGTSRMRASFVSQYLDLLALQEQSRSKVDFYLQNYESLCEKNTIPYSGFLGTKANIMWRCGCYKEAWQAICAYEGIYEKTKEAWGFSDIKNLKGMILREMNRIDESLDVFEETADSSAKYGNIARCYQMRGEHEMALKNLALCLRKLEDKDNLYTDFVNRGYAYLWIAETFYAQQDNDKAKKFLLFCQENWKEYAPGLLPQTYGLLEKLNETELVLDSAEMQQLLDDFLQQNLPEN